MRMKTIRACCIVAFCTLVAASLAPLSYAQARQDRPQGTPMRIVALGDSLTAGYGLQGGQDYPSRLQEALRQQGYDVTVDNAGVSGDTSAGGLARIEWAIAGERTPDLVIVALGANDMLRGIAVSETEKNLRGILQKLKDRNIPAILYGMKAPINMPLMFRSNLEKMYIKLAREFDAPLYPFFLEGVAMEPDMNIADGYHPNEKGIAHMVEKTLPLVTKRLDRLGKKR